MATFSSDRTHQGSQRHTLEVVGMSLESNFCFSKTLVDICQRRHIRVISVNVAVAGKHLTQDRPLNLVKGAGIEALEKERRAAGRGREARSGIPL